MSGGVIKKAQTHLQSDRLYGQRPKDSAPEQDKEVLPHLGSEWRPSIC